MNVHDKGRAFRPTAMLFSLAALLLVSCGVSKTAEEGARQNQGAASSEHEAGSAPTHIWYAFTKDGFTAIDFPSLAPKVDFAPWTEAVRVCDASMLGNGFSLGAFFLVNRLGMFTFLGDGSIKLTREVSFFSNSTVDSLMIIENAPVFHHYANSVFKSDSEPPSTILIRFDPMAHIFYPALLKREMRLDPYEEVTALSFFEGEWLFQIRRFDKEQSADYRAFAFLESLANPSIQKRITERQITQGEFWRSLQGESYDAAPARVKSLLPIIPQGVPFYLECRFQDVAAVKRFSTVDGEAANQDSAWEEIHANAVIADTYAAALLEDGTLFFQGALTGHQNYKNNEAAALKLPPLPEGFVYGKCIISGGKLFASWEEKRFYETARSGFVQVNLDALLYGENR
jgi:hypothetical protein